MQAWPKDKHQVYTWAQECMHVLQSNRVNGQRQRHVSKVLAGPWMLHLEKPPYPVVVGAVDVSGHAEVSDLHQQVGSNQAVPGGQVAMHKVLGGQVHHAGGDLTGNVEHLGEPQLAFRLAWLPIHKDHRIWPMGPVAGEGRRRREGAERVQIKEKCLLDSLISEMHHRDE